MLQSGHHPGSIFEQAMATLPAASCVGAAAAAPGGALQCQPWGSMLWGQPLFPVDGSSMCQQVAVGLPVCFPVAGIPLGPHQEELTLQDAVVYSYHCLSPATPAGVTSHPAYMCMPSAEAVTTLVTSPQQQQQQQQQEEEGQLQQQQERLWGLDQGEQHWVHLVLHDSTTATAAAAAAAAAGSTPLPPGAVVASSGQLLPQTAAVQQPMTTAAGGAAPPTAAAAAVAIDTWPPSGRPDDAFSTCPHPTSSMAAGTTSCTTGDEPTCPSSPPAAARGGGGVCTRSQPWLPPLLPAVGPGSSLDMQDLLKAIPPGVPVNPDLPPVRVNPKQYACILRRRLQRARAGRQQRGVTKQPRKPYRHESRHIHATRRVRGARGRFLAAAAAAAAEEEEEEAAAAATPVSRHHHPREQEEVQQQQQRHQQQQHQMFAASLPQLVDVSMEAEAVSPGGGGGGGVCAEAWQPQAVAAAADTDVQTQQQQAAMAAAAAAAAAGAGPWGHMFAPAGVPQLLVPGPWGGSMPCWPQGWWQVQPPGLLGPYTAAGDSLVMHPAPWQAPAPVPVSNGAAGLDADAGSAGAEGEAAASMRHSSDGSEATLMWSPAHRLPSDASVAWLGSYGLDAAAAAALVSPPGYAIQQQQQQQVVMMPVVHPCGLDVLSCAPGSLRQPAAAGAAGCAGRGACSSPPLMSLLDVSDMEEEEGGQVEGEEEGECGSGTGGSWQPSGLQLLLA